MLWLSARVFWKGHADQGGVSVGRPKEAQQFRVGAGQEDAGSK